MKYKFLIKAQSQPDLVDFCEYLIKPLMVLEDILHKYKNLQSAKKFTPENVVISHKVESILNQHLPEMVDNFCDFSFEYRNNVKINIDENTSLTAKELLLKNLAKVIEEVKLIEKDFNLNNSFAAIVQTKVLSNYGFQPELSLETGKITHESIELGNKFNYEKFVESTQFKNTTAPKFDSNRIESTHKKQVEVSQNQNVTKTFYSTHSDPIMKPSTMGAGATLGVIIGGCIIFGILGLVFNDGTNYNKKSQNTRQFTEQISKIQSHIKELNPNGEYSKLSQQQLLTSKFFNSKNLTLSWGENIKVESYQHPSYKNDFYVLKFNIPSNKKQEKKVCEYILTLKDQLTRISFDNNYIDTENPQFNTYFHQYCSSGTVSLIAG